MQRKVSKRGLMLSATLAAPALIHNAAYANTLTNLVGQLYAGVDVISRELVGFIPAVTRNASAERAALGQSVTYPITPEAETFDVTPAMAIPEPADVVMGNGIMAITKSKGVEFGWTGEEQRALNNGVGYVSTQANLFAQGLRKLVNEIESDLAIEAAVNASRATGEAGETPFSEARGVGDTAQLRKILDDNGAPLSGRALLIDTSAGANLRTLRNLNHVNEAGTTLTLRDGQLLDLHAFSIHESAGIRPLQTGTAAGMVTNAAGYPEGATVITLAAGGTGNLRMGDVVTFAGDPNKYVVAAASAAVGAGQTIRISAPGLRQAIPAASTAVTKADGFTPNVGFSPDAIHLVARAPALPAEGDAAIDRMLITDPRSGLVFEVSIYPGYRKIRAEVAMSWGVKAVKREHIALLMG